MFHRIFRYFVKDHILVVERVLALQLSKVVALQSHRTRVATFIASSDNVVAIVVIASESKVHVDAKVSASLARCG